MFDPILVLLGHLAIACVVFNRAHAFARPATRHKFSVVLTALFASLPLLVMVAFRLLERPLNYYDWSFGWQIYFVAARTVAIIFALRWVFRCLTDRLPAGVQKIDSYVVDVGAQTTGSLVHGWKAKLLNWIPGNQTTRLNVETWVWEFADLPNELDGLKICQLSDLHLTGFIDRAFYEHMVEIVKSHSPDLIFITGDVVEADACLDWLEPIFSNLRARHGVFYVLGNHDLFVSDQAQYRERLAKCGMTMAADGNWHCIPIGAAEVAIAGNELPWYRGALELSTAAPSESALRILLSHSPDQIAWAASRQFDLVFAGHTHGGQIRLPLVGPIIAPSRYGIKYAAGTFQFRKTLMHVSRGIAGDEPIRLNCLPEIGIFVLKRA